MPAASRQSVLRAAALLAAVSVAACSSHATSRDDALRRDLDAASGDGLTLAPRGSQTQVVSALELGTAGKATPTGVPARAHTGAPATPAVPQRLAARAPVAAPRVIERVRIIERVVDRAPAPEPEVATAPAAVPTPAPVASVPEDAPVAAPSPGSRHLPSTDDGSQRHERHRRPWDMGDVIRNAPFPINP